MFQAVAQNHLSYFRSGGSTGYSYVEGEDGAMSVKGIGGAEKSVRRVGWSTHGETTEGQLRSLLFHSSGGNKPDLTCKKKVGNLKLIMHPYHFLLFSM